MKVATIFIFVIENTMVFFIFQTRDFREKILKIGVRFIKRKKGKDTLESQSAETRFMLYSLGKCGASLDESSL